MTPGKLIVAGGKASGWGTRIRNLDKQSQSLWYCIDIAPKKFVMLRLCRVHCELENPLFREKRILAP